MVAVHSKIRKTLLVLLILLIGFSNVRAEEDKGSALWQSIPEEKRENAEAFYAALISKDIPVPTAAAMTARGYSESGFDPYKLESFNGVGGSGWELRHLAGYDHVPPAYGFLQMQGRKPGDRLAVMLKKVETHKGGAGTRDPKVASEAQGLAAAEEFEGRDPFKSFPVRKVTMVFTSSHLHGYGGNRIPPAYTLPSKVGQSLTGLLVESTGNFYPIPDFEKFNAPSRVASWEDFKKIEDPRVAAAIWTVAIVRPANWAVYKTAPNDMALAEVIAKELGNLKTFGFGDDFKEKSLLRDKLSPVLLMKENKGFFLDLDGKKEEKSNQIAQELQTAIINDKQPSERYSLYQRFGSDVHFFRYLGEITTPIELFDYLYSKVDADQENSIELKDFWHDSKVYLSNNVYTNRPKVLSKSDIDEGKVDPRVATIGNGLFNGMDYTWGQFKLDVSKTITGFVTTLMGTEILTNTRDVVNEILTGEIFTQVYKPILFFFLGFGVIALVISLVEYGRKYALGKGTVRQFRNRFLVGSLSIALLFVITTTPAAFINTTFNGLMIFDQLFNEAVNTTFQEDEVIYSDDSADSMEAALWKTSIFQPWVRGIFRRDYEDLNSQFADVPLENKMPQSNMSNDEIIQQAEGEYGYNSADLTGDIQVPLGNKVSRNWAAYLYSTQSKYHIDQDVIDKVNTTPRNIFPSAKTTAGDNKINADTFRVIDAMMDVSPQIYKDGLTINNYTGAKMLNMQQSAQGTVMIMNSLMLLISFLPMILNKLRYMILSLISFLQLGYLTIVELFAEGKGLAPAWGKFSKYFLEFIISSFKLFILTVTYTLLIGKGIIPFVIYVFIVLTIYGTNLKQLRRDFTYRVEGAKQYGRKLRNNLPF